MWILIVALLAVPSFADCGKGCAMYGTVCACEESPEAAPSVKPSAEKPPKSGVAAYDSTAIKAEMPQSLIYKDSQQDQEILEADKAGKHAAGIN